MISPIPENIDDFTTDEKLKWIIEHMAELELFFSEALTGVNDDILGLRDDLNIFEQTLDEVQDEIDGIEWLDEEKDEEGNITYKERKKHESFDECLSKEKKNKKKGN